MRAGRNTIFAGVLALAASCAMPPERAVRTGTTTQAADWSSGAVDPIRIRRGHTATLLGTGEVLVAGGTSANTTEIIDPYHAVVRPGPNLLEGRTGHTATMLLSGKVLLAGGAVSSAEIFDPVTRTTAPTGAMAQSRQNHVAIRLRDGRVLVTGGGADLTTEIYDPQAGTWSAGPARVGEPKLNALATLADGRLVGVSQARTEILDATVTAWTKGTALFPFSSFNEQTLTRAGNNRIVDAWVQACATLDGIHSTCASYTSVLGAAAAAIADGPEFDTGRSGYTAVRTIEGNVEIIGGTGSGVLAAELLTDFAAAKLTPDGTLTSEHIRPSATVLPGGDILVVGGAQAKLERRPSPGAWRDPGFLLLHSRESHAATRLHDGTVLVAGGQNAIASFPPSKTPVLEAEIIDVAKNTATPVTGALPSGHLDGTLTTLRDGRALLAGGGTADVAIYTAPSFAAGPPMATARSNHTATLLPSGRVLVVGGTPAVTASEIFDPATNAWTTGPTPAHAFTAHGAVLMPNGKVLVVNGADAEIFDEVANAFQPTTAPGALRDGITAHLLPNGKVFLAGGTTLAAELFDPATETWSYTSSALQAQAVLQRWVAVPSGKLVASGGHPTGIDSDLQADDLFDPLAHPTGAFVDSSTSANVAFRHTATLAGTGEVLQTGGFSCNGACVADSLNEMSVWSDGAAAALRPTITAVPATVTAGTKVQIAGTAFANGAEASDGTHSSSPVNHPTAVWIADAGDAVVPSTILEFTDTTATWLVPTTALYGHGLLFVNVGGVMSIGASVTILPALAATGCANDAECKTGFCTDGVCCDRRCDGTCEACTAAKKTSGEDGVCGAVPPGVGTCILKLGEACKGGNECGTGFCAQGVCCDSTCDGQCLSCNLQGKVGRCSAINEGACGAACDGDHTLKQIGLADVDCAPYKCSGPQCNQTCGSARDCVAPAVCSYDGHCVPPVAPAAGSDSVCGCRAVGAPAPSSGALFLVALAAACVRRRRGR